MKKLIIKLFIIFFALLFVFSLFESIFGGILTRFYILSTEARFIVFLIIAFLLSRIFRRANVNSVEGNHEYRKPGFSPGFTGFLVLNFIITVVIYILKLIVRLLTVPFSELKEKAGEDLAATLDHIRELFFMGFKQ